LIKDSLIKLGFISQFWRLCLIKCDLFWDVSFFISYYFCLILSCIFKSLFTFKLSFPHVKELLSLIILFGVFSLNSGHFVHDFIFVFSSFSSSLSHLFFFNQIFFISQRFPYFIPFLYFLSSLSFCQVICIRNLGKLIIYSLGLQSTTVSWYSIL